MKPNFYPLTLLLSTLVISPLIHAQQNDTMQMRSAYDQLDQETGGCKNVLDAKNKDINRYRAILRQQKKQLEAKDRRIVELENKLAHSSATIVVNNSLRAEKSPPELSNASEKTKRHTLNNVDFTISQCSSDGSGLTCILNVLSLKEDSLLTVTAKTEAYTGTGESYSLSKAQIANKTHHMEHYPRKLSQTLIKQVPTTVQLHFANVPERTSSVSALALSLSVGDMSKVIKIRNIAVRH